MTGSGRNKMEPVNQVASVDKTAFICPHCSVFSNQEWYSVSTGKFGINRTPLLVPPRADPEGDLLPYMVVQRYSGVEDGRGIVNLNISLCQHCSKIAIWIGDRLAYPDRGCVPPPNQDLPDDIKRDYEEAGAVVGRSPRGAAALLRLCIEKLCANLGDPKRSLDKNIGTLVAEGLDKKVQRALDIVRVVGNSAVHPGTLDVKDDIITARTLFDLVNLIANTMISQQRDIDEMYDTLPKTKREGIDARDKKKGPL